MRDKFTRLAVAVVLGLSIVGAPTASIANADSQFEYLWPTPELAANPNANATLSWLSPDGRYTALGVSDAPAGVSKVWLVDRATNHSEILEGAINDPQLSSDTHYMLYQRSIDGRSVSLWLKDRLTGSEVQVDADPTNPYPNAQTIIGAPGSRSLSDDGSVALFAAWNFKAVPGAPSNTYNLYSYERSSGQYVLINDPTEGEVSTGTISGNGRYILYQVRQPSLSYAMYVYDRSTATRIQIGAASVCHGNALRTNHDGSVVSYTCSTGSRVINLSTMESRTVFDGDAVVTSMSDDGNLLVGGTHGNYHIYSWQTNETRPIEEEAITGNPLVSGNGLELAWTIERPANPPGVPYVTYVPKIGPTPVFASADVSPPLISYHLSPTSTNDWRNTPVTLSWSVSDPDSTVTSTLGCESVTVSTMGKFVYTCTATSAGGTSSVTALVGYDPEIPTLTAPTWSQNPKPTSGTTTLTVPAIDDTSGVAGGEYFIGDEDPGQGNGISMDLDDSNLSTTFGTGLSPGVYKINVRAVDNAGNWSEVLATELVVDNPDETPPMLSNLDADYVMWRYLFPDTRRLTVVATDALSGVAGGEYFVDTDPGEGNGIPLIVNGSTLSGVVPANTPLGFHRLYVRAKDNAGNWSGTISRWFFIGIL